MSTVAAATDLALGLTNLDEEVVLDDVELEGQLPAWLGGTLLRTGPARWDLPDQTVNHWFDGLAMLHRFTISAGRVSYANRFLRSKAYEAAEREGRLVFGEFATDPCRSAFKRVVSLFDPQITDNGAVNVSRLLGEWVALTEGPIPVAFDPETLRTLNVDLELPVTTGGIAHPHDGGGKALFMGVHMGPRSSYRLVEDRTVKARIPTREPAYIHSFALTERFAILTEHPFTVNPLKLGLGLRTFIESFAWHPDRPTRLHLIDRATGRHLGRWETDPFFVFHHVNAYDDGDDVVVDLCAYEDAEIVHALGLGKLRAGEEPPMAKLTRLRLKPDHSVERTTLSDESFELPRIDYGRVNAEPYRVAYGVGGFLDRIVKVDVTTGETLTWDQPGSYPGEPVFVGRPGRDREDDGVLLSVVLEPERQASSMLVLDAADLSELARARVPHHIPFGFHGQFARG